MIVIFICFQQTRNDLKKHSYKHSSNDWKCCQCPEKFNSSFFLKVHTVLAHENGLFKCRLCAVTEQTRIQVVEHYDEEHGVF